MSNFTQRSQSYTDARLFEIVREAEKYAPEAVAAAEVEIERRGLLADNFPQEEKAKPFGKLRGLAEKFSPPIDSERGDDIIDWITKPERGNTAGEKYLLYLMSVMGITGLIGIYDQWDYINYALGPLADGFDPIVAFIFLALCFQFFLIYLLWRKNRIACYITACFAALGLINTLFLMPYLFQRKDHGPGGLLDLIDLFAPTISPVQFLVNATFSVAVIWLVTRKDLMELFGIAQKNLTIAIVLGVAYSLVSNLLFGL